MAKEQTALGAWRADAQELALEPQDLELLDNVLCVVPEMRIVAFLGREARRRGIKYPVKDVKQLVGLLKSDVIQIDGRQVDAESVARALPNEWFPLAHEGELLSAIHLGLRRCQAEATAAILDAVRSGRRTTDDAAAKTVKKTKKR